MHILLSCSKNMNDGVSQAEIPFYTKPLYQEKASELALYMTQYSVAELERLLRVNPQIALENLKRFQVFHAPNALEEPAIFRYSGVVFKHINAASFTKKDYAYAQQKLRITSFIYGLLRPLDLIKLYRLEGDVRLEELNDMTIFSYWKDILTKQFIADINDTGGVLCNLASNEMKKLFHWTKVKRSLKRVITPSFKVWKNGKYKTIVVYTKMCRGEMAQYIIKNKIEEPEDLKAFKWEGFEYNEELSEGDDWVFVNSNLS